MTPPTTWNTTQPSDSSLPPGPEHFTGKLQVSFRFPVIQVKRPKRRVVYLTATMTSRHELFGFYYSIIFTVQVILKASV